MTSIEHTREELLAECEARLMAAIERSIASGVDPKEACARYARALAETWPHLAGALLEKAAGDAR